MRAPRPSRAECDEIDRFGMFDEDEYARWRGRGPQSDVEGVLYGFRVVLGALGLVALVGAVSGWAVLRLVGWL